MNLISIITPSYNNADYIKECLLSVLNQSGTFAIEHIVVDGVSSDNTIQILKEFEKDISNGKLKPKCKQYTFKWISEKDKGMYDAIVKGFNMSSGNIMAWINADDKYQEGVFEFVSNIFNDHPNILWLKGITDYIEKDGSKKLGYLNKYSQKLIAKGVYGSVAKYIQQDSVFWRSELWNNVNHEEIVNYKLAGDFRLWQLFAQRAKLYSFNQHVSYFRKREGQLSSKTNEYKAEVDNTTQISPLEKHIYKIIDKIERAFRSINLGRN